jgi:hypothetical protein
MYREDITPHSMQDDSLTRKSKALRRLLRTSADDMLIVPPFGIPGI